MILQPPNPWKINGVSATRRSGFEAEFRTLIFHF